MLCYCCTGSSIGSKVWGTTFDYAVEYVQFEQFIILADINMVYCDKIWRLFKRKLELYLVRSSIVQIYDIKL